MNFWKVCQYFWAVCFIIFTLNLLVSLNVEYLWRMGGSVVMILIFASASALAEDKRLLRK